MVIYAAKRLLIIHTIKKKPPGQKFIFNVMLCGVIILMPRIPRISCISRIPRILILILIVFQWDEIIVLS